MDKHVFTDKQKKLIAWAAIAIFLLLSAAVGWFIGRPLVRFASRPEEFRLWVDGHGLLGMAAYVGMVFLQVVVAVIPGEPLEISGGYAFGALRGSVLCLLGGVLGSVAVFALVRRFGRELVEIFFPREKLEKLKFLQSSPKRDALFWLIFTVPGTSKLSPICTAAAEASRCRNGTPAAKVSAKAVSIYRSALLEGGTFISARRLRMLRMTSMICSISFSCAGKQSAGSYTGHGAIISASPSCGRDCQISSVMNGIKGCSRVSIPVMT